MDLHKLIIKVNSELLQKDVYFSLQEYMDHIIQILGNAASLIVTYKQIFNQFREKTLSQIQFINKMNSVFKEHKGKQTPKIFYNTHPIITPDNVINCCNEIATIIMDRYYWFNDIVANGYSDYQFKYKTIKMEAQKKTPGYKNTAKSIDTLHKLIAYHDKKLQQIQIKINKLNGLF